MTIDSVHSCSRTARPGLCDIVYDIEYNIGYDIMPMQNDIGIDIGYDIKNVPVDFCSENGGPCRLRPYVGSRRCEVCHTEHYQSARLDVRFDVTIPNADRGRVVKADIPCSLGGLKTCNDSECTPDSI